MAPYLNGSSVGRSDTPKLKVGDRVHVEFDAVIEHVNGSGKTYELSYEGSDKHGNADFVPEFAITKLPDPLKVGDVLGADSPEPPIGTVVLDSDGRAWQRCKENWAPAEPDPGNGYVPDNWDFVAGDDYGSVTVLHVGSDA